MKRPPKLFLGQSKPEKVINTLLIDGNALFKVGYHGAIREVNWRGEKIGAIYQFITVLRKLLLEDLYHKVYVFWDGPLSGKLRYDVYSDYKKDRGKNYSTGLHAKEEDPYFIEQQIRVKKYLEELFVRQIEDEVVEGDDLISFYCLHKEKNEKITICTNDRDISQLLSNDVRIYFCDKKIFVTVDNFKEHFGFHHSNVKLIKVITGDMADSIKGVKGVQTKTLLTYFPEIKERSVQLDEVLRKAKAIQAERMENKQKPLKAIDNLIEQRTDGIQGDRLFEINDKIIDLKNPFMTKESIDMMIDHMSLPLNPDGRDIKNVYKMIKEDGLTRLIGTNNIADYLIPFKKLIEREIKNFNNF